MEIERIQFNKILTVYLVFEGMIASTSYVID